MFDHLLAGVFALTALVAIFEAARFTFGRRWAFGAVAMALMGAASLIVAVAVWVMR